MGVDSEVQSTAQPSFNRKLFVIGAMRLIDSMSINMIMPYGLELVSRLLHQGTASPEVGKAFAWLIGLYSLFEIVFSPVWGVVADIIGRKPCLLIGLAGTAIAPILLSLGQSLTAVLVFRALDGFFCGNQAILRTYLGELVEKTQEARAFSFLVLFFVLGLIAGPFLGGLAFPAVWAPDLFGETVFDQYPVLLPNLLFGIVTAIVCIIGFVMLDESLPKNKRCVWQKNQASGDDMELADGESEGSSKASSDTGKARGSNCCYSLPVLQALLAFCGLAGAIEAQNTLLVLVWQYPQSSGGFGFTPQEVSAVQIAGGLGPVLGHLSLFRKLVRKMGFLNVLVLGFVLNSLCYTLYPLFAHFNDPVKYGVWRFVILGLAEIVGMSGTFLMFSPVFIFVNRASEGLSRGVVNGWANSGRALTRAIAPLAATQLLQVSKALGPDGLYLPFLSATACLGLCLVFSWTGLQRLFKLLHEPSDLNSWAGRSYNYCNFEFLGCGLVAFAMVAFVDFLAAAGPIFVVASFATPAGLGGGMLYVPLLLVFRVADARAAVALAQATIVGAGAAGSLFDIARHLRHKEQQILDGRLALAMIAPCLAGNLVGSVLNQFLPSTIIMVLLMMLTVTIFWTSARRALNMWREESALPSTDRPFHEKSSDCAAAEVAAETKVWACPVEATGQEHTAEDSEATEETADDTSYQYAFSSSDSESVVSERAPACESEPLPLPASSMASASAQAGSRAFSGCQTWMMFLLVWICMILVYVLRGGGHGDSIIGIRCCSWLYWAITAGGFLLLMFVTVLTRQPQAPWYLCLATGAMSPVVGIGGAIVLNPMMVNRGIEVQAATSTASLMVLVMSTGNTSLFVLGGFVPALPAAMLSVTAFLGAMCGKTVVNYVVKRTGRKSFLVILVTVFVGVSAVMVAIQGSIETIHSFRAGENPLIAFHTPC